MFKHRLFVHRVSASSISWKTRTQCRTRTFSNL